EPRPEIAIDEYWLDAGPGNTQDSNLRCVDYWREGRAADGAKTRNGEATALHVTGFELLAPGLVGKFDTFACNFPDTFFIDVADDRHQQTGRRVDRHSNMNIVLVNHLMTIE